MACASEDTGFHSAITRSQCGIGSVGTNVLARNVIGNSAVNITPLTASTVRINEPIRMPNQMIAKPNSNSSAKASTASPMLLRMRHPIASPVTAITTTPNEEWITLAMLRPISTEDREMGSARNRSMMPFSTSAVIPAATTNAENTMVCA